LAFYGVFMTLKVSTICLHAEEYVSGRVTCLEVGIVKFSF